MEMFLFLLMKLLQGVRALLGLVLAGIDQLICLIDARLQVINDGPVMDEAEDVQDFIKTSSERPDRDASEKEEAVSREEPDDLDERVKKALLNKPLRDETAVMSGS